MKNSDLTFTVAGGTDRYITAKVYNLRYPTVLVKKKRQRSTNEPLYFKFRISVKPGVYKVQLWEKKRWWSWKSRLASEFVIDQTLLNSIVK